ncbi:hypothetical protein BV372_33585 [Nostoc sp. T09]|uniref:GIY-YIG nuclease family protein n=1 Tax=Nostoc sp. T09 TaxID=1932621 RepID=UPI000A381DF2|nr:GIY-YIG nuclease family protein [Nostoc sp. T09]OUL19230.1 hypothetical protein BV372_33585 [Nostoc sp. T09]
MSHRGICLQSVPFERFAFRFTPEVVRILIPNDLVGVYLLFDQGEAVYVGRSDNCLRTRLANHPFVGQASYFTYEICHSRLRAFYLEAYWFHRLQEFAPQRLLNSIHPAKPANCSQTCPFCNSKNSKALKVAFSTLGILDKPFNF